MVAQYDPAVENKDENLEFTQKEVVPISMLLTRFAKGSDRCLLAFGLFWSFMFGASFPALIVVFGNMVDDLGSIEGTNGENPMK